MKKRKIAAVSAGLLIVALAALFTVKTLLETDMARNIKNVSREYDIPEIAVAVMNSQEILYKSVSGVRRTGTAESAGPDDRFHIGSCTKAVTSLIAGKLVEEGRISWETKLLDIYPEFAGASLDEYKSVTLADLLSNRAGVQPFTDFTGEFTLLPDFKGAITEKRRDFTGWLLGKPKDARWIEQTKQMGYDIQTKDKPFVYSNAGFSAAASMLETVSGKTWEELVKQYLGDGLGLEPGFGWPNVSDPEQSWGHAVIDGKLTATPPENGYRLPELIAPAGDLNFTLNDYSELIRMQLGGLRGEDGFLKAETVEYIHKSLPGYALGWQNMELFGHRISFHDGTAGTFCCIAAIDDEHDLAFVLMANAGGEKAMKGLYWLAYKIFKNYNRMYWLFFV